MAKKIVAQPNATNKATPNETYCPTCNEHGMFCFCDVKEKSKQAKALEVKRLKRGTFLFSFVGGHVWCKTIHVPDSKFSYDLRGLLCCS